MSLARMLRAQAQSTFENDPFIKPDQLPPVVELGPRIGSGSRAKAYHAKLGNQIVVLKVYSKRVSERYQRKYGVQISDYEFGRNQEAYDLPALRPYCAKPIAAFGSEGKFTPCFVQEYVNGTPLVDLADDLGGVPQQIIEHGWRIAEAAHAAGLEHLDLDPANIIVRRVGEEWLPVLYDFNGASQELRSPNGLLPFLGTKRGTQKLQRNERFLSKVWPRLAQWSM